MIKIIEKLKERSKSYRDEANKAFLYFEGRRCRYLMARADGIDEAIELISNEEHIAEE